MHGYPSPYQTYFPVIMPFNSPVNRFSYPPVDVTIFTHSVQSFRLLMEQGNVLLNRLNDASFARKLMDAAQKGQQREVDNLVKSIGLKVPVTTRYTPSGVTFSLSLSAVNCCVLTLSLKWGRI